MRARAAAAIMVLGAVTASGCGGSGSSSSSTSADYPVPSLARSDLHGCGKRHELAQYRCASIKVPLVRGDQSLGSKRIAFAIRYAPDAKPGATPIFAVEGGPGYGSSRTEPAYTNLFGGLRRTHDLVFVDMRGTGRSGGLRCPNVQKGLGPFWITVATCAQRLGPKIEGYTTAEAAADINDVRRALGFGKIGLYGDSYGTYLGQSYAFRYPRTLRTLVLDSAYPARGENAWYPSLPRTGIRSYAIACRRDPSCRGDPAKRLVRLTHYLRETHRSVTDLVDLIAGAAYGPPASYLKIDRAGRALMNGNPGEWRRLTYENKVGVAEPEHYSRADEYVVGCNDYPMIWKKNASQSERLKEFEAAIQHHAQHTWAPFTPREIAYAPGLAYLECLAFPRHTANYQPPVPKGAKPSKAPVLVVSGELDDTTTAREGNTVTAEFPNGQHYVARNVGHVASLYDGQSPAARHIRAFLRQHLRGT